MNGFEISQKASGNLETQARGGRDNCMASDLSSIDGDAQNELRET
jgi:hypothetical protein